MSLLMACMLAIIVIIGYWAGLYLAVWLGHRIAMKAVLRMFGTTDPDQLLQFVADKIRGHQKP